MSIATLFRNLSNFTNQPLQFGEDSLLDTLEFNESGLVIRNILNRRYPDGITGLESVNVEGNIISGIFLDQISPTITKKFNFTIDGDTGRVIYDQIDTGNLDYSEVSFATKKNQSCTKGKSFGCTREEGTTYCIPLGRKCQTSKKLDAKELQQVSVITKAKAAPKTTKTKAKLPVEKKPKVAKEKQPKKEKVTKQPEKSELQRIGESVGAEYVLPSGIAEVDVAKIGVDPKRFQYKLIGQHNASGSVGSLSGVRKWDADLAGIIQVWHDPADGKTYVINGHNRTERARALGVEKITAKFIKANTAEEARAIGALTNIAEGRGNALDSAKFFRDSGISRQDLEAKGIPMREKIATDGLAMANLSEPLFDRVVQGSIPEQRAIVIGQSLKDHKQQQELVDMIEKEEKKGKKITNDTIKELTDMITTAPTVTSDQGGLFGLLGFEPESRSLAIEKAQVQANLKRQLSREKKLFGIVGKSKAAQDLEKAGNKIDVEKSSEISDTASKALVAFDQEKGLSGKVSDLVNSAAKRIADGESRSKVEKETYRDIVDHLKKTYKF